MQLVTLPYELCIGSLICRLCIMFNICINYSTCQENTALKTSRAVLIINPFDFPQIPFSGRAFSSLEYLVSSSLCKGDLSREKPLRSWLELALGKSWEVCVRSCPWRKALTLRAEFSFLSSLLDSGDTFLADHITSIRTSIILEVVIIGLDDAYITKTLTRWSH